MYRWALVKDKEVAKKMTKFIELNTIGVSKDSQLRAAKVLRAVSDSIEQEGSYEEGESFFKYSYNLMSQRWKQLREAVERSGMFSLPSFSAAFCTFFSQVLEPQPGNNKAFEFHSSLLINFRVEEGPDFFHLLCSFCVVEV